MHYPTKLFFSCVLAYRASVTSKDSIGFGKGGGETLLSEDEEETLTLVDEGESSLEIAD